MMTIDQGTPSAQPSVEPLVSVRNLTRHFTRPNGDVVRAIDGINIDVFPGEVLVLLGPSGCGKTTLLRSIAGLETPESGTISINGRTMFSSEERINVPTERRSLSMIFQSYALWPHMTAGQNVAYPLRSRGVGRAERAKRVRDALGVVGVAELIDTYPGQMSGGQQQRIAFARALVSGDQLILFDEPLSNVDAKVREQLRIELLEMQQELNFTALYVTHDQTEAMAVADRIAVLRIGTLAQLGDPKNVYDHPDSYYVANFIGAMNEEPGVVESVDGPTHIVVTESGRVRSTSVAAGVAAHSEVVALSRPESYNLTASEPPDVNRFRVTVVTRMFCGSHVEFVVSTEQGRHLRVWSAHQDAWVAGDELWCSVPDDAVRLVSREASA